MKLLPKVVNNIVQRLPDGAKFDRDGANHLKARVR